MVVVVILGVVVAIVVVMLVMVAGGLADTSWRERDNKRHLFVKTVLAKINVG